MLQLLISVIKNDQNCWKRMIRTRKKLMKRWVSLYQRAHVCDLVPMLVGQVSIVSLGWHQPKAINTSFDWKALGVICKQNTINRYKIKVFCLFVWLRWLYSEIWTIFLKKGKRIWVLVWTSSKCWDYHVFKLMPIPRIVCLIFNTGCDIGLLLVKGYSGTSPGG